MRCLLLSHDLADNALGRAYSHWLIGRELGWATVTAGPTSTGELWAPLQKSEFASSCRRLRLPLADRRSELRELVDWADVVIAIKLWPRSLGLALRVTKQTGLPLLIDIDDPDLETVEELVAGPDGFRNRVHFWRRGVTVAHLHRLRERAAGYSRITSNPALRELYGGAVVPHARSWRESGDPHMTSACTVAFVGTPRLHKGIDVVRAAVARLADEGFTLVVTGPVPRDARPWERWVGWTSLAEGQRIVDHADIVALPSLPTHAGRRQLPVKLIDAMMASRAIVVSDLPTLRWAVGDAGGLVVRPGSVADLEDALRRLRDPALRTQLGADARRRAGRMFTPAAVAPAFSAAVRSAAGSRA